MYTQARAVIDAWLLESESSHCPSLLAPCCQNYAFNYGVHTGQPPSQEFPAVPYGPTDFHCERALNSWNEYAHTHNFFFRSEFCFLIARFLRWVQSAGSQCRLAVGSG